MCIQTIYLYEWLSKSIYYTHHFTYADDTAILALFKNSDNDSFLTINIL